MPDSVTTGYESKGIGDNSDGFYHNFVGREYPHTTEAKKTKKASVYVWLSLTSWSPSLPTVKVCMDTGFKEHPCIKVNLGKKFGNPSSDNERIAVLKVSKKHVIGDGGNLIVCIENYACESVSLIGNNKFVTQFDGDSIGL